MAFGWLVDTTRYQMTSPGTDQFFQQKLNNVNSKGCNPIKITFPTLDFQTKFTMDRIKKLWFT